MSFDLDLLNVDPAFLDGLLGSNTKLGGSINGHMGISGKVGAPEIRGHASLENGSYVSDLERTPILGATATLTFNRSSAQISRLFARVGSGTVFGRGASNFRMGFPVRAISRSTLPCTRRTRNWIFRLTERARSTPTWR